MWNGEFPGFSALLRCCTATNVNSTCTVDVSIKLKEGSAKIMQPKNSMFYTITLYILNRRVKTCVLSQLYVSNQSKHQFLLIYSCLRISSLIVSHHLQLYAEGVHITR